MGGERTIVPVPSVLVCKPSAVCEFQRSSFEISHHGEEGVADVPAVYVPLALAMMLELVDLHYVERKIRPS